jgi:hypothetical protein
LTQNYINFLPDSHHTSQAIKGGGGIGGRDTVLSSSTFALSAMLLNWLLTKDFDDPLDATAHFFCSIRGFLARRAHTGGWPR